MACKQYRIFVLDCQIHLKEIGLENEFLFSSVKSITQSTVTFGTVCEGSRTFSFSDIVSPPFDTTQDLLDFLETELTGCNSAGCEFCITSDQNDALDNANAPNAGNPFATIDDLNALGLCPPKSGNLIPGAFSGNPLKATVTFGAAYDDADYTPDASGQLLDNYAFTFESITAAGFVVNLNSITVPTNDILWSAVKGDCGASPLFDDHWTQVPDLATAATLTGLAVGDMIHIQDINLTVYVESISGGSDWATATVKYYDYAAMGRTAKNEGTADLATTFILNSTPVLLRTRTSIGSVLQAVNMDHILDGDSQFMIIKDPLMVGKTSGDPRYMYQWDCNITLTASDVLSSYEFHFCLRDSGGGITTVIDSIQFQAPVANQPYSINLGLQQNRAYDEAMGIQVERIGGSGFITVRRFNLMGSFIGQRGYYS